MSGVSVPILRIAKGPPDFHHRNDEHTWNRKVSEEEKYVHPPERLLPPGFLSSTSWIEESPEEEVKREGVEFQVLLSDPETTGEEVHAFLEALEPDVRKTLLESELPNGTLPLKWVLNQDPFTDITLGKIEALLTTRLIPHTQIYDAVETIGYDPRLNGIIDLFRLFLKEGYMASGHICDGIYHYIRLYRDQELIELLSTESVQDCFHPKEDGRSPLIEACGLFPSNYREASNLISSILQYYITNRIEYSNVSPNGESALLYALSRGVPIEFISQICDIPGMDLNAVDTMGNYPLQFAVGIMSKGLLTLFIERGAREQRERPAREGEEGPQPIDGLVQTLLDNIDVIERDPTRTPLFLSIVETILRTPQVGIQLNDTVVVKGIRTPLLLYVVKTMFTNGKTEEWKDLLHGLLERGANPNVKGMYDETLAHYAAHYHSIWLTNLCVEKGLSGWELDVHGYSPIHRLQSDLDSMPIQETYEIETCILNFIKGVPEDETIYTVKLQTMMSGGVPKEWKVPKSMLLGEFRNLVRDLTRCEAFKDTPPEERNVGWILNATHLLSTLQKTKFAYIFAGRILDDESASLEEIGIRNGSTIRIVVQMKTGRGGTRRKRRSKGRKTERRRSRGA